MTIIDAQVCAILQKMVQTCEDTQSQRASARTVTYERKLRSAPDLCIRKRRIN